MKFLIILLVVVVVVVALLRLRRVMSDRQQQVEQTPPSVQETTPVNELPTQQTVTEYQQPQYPQAQTVQPQTVHYQQPVPPPPPPAATYTQPPGTIRDLDDENAVRPEVDSAALAAARASVSQEIPDEVLKDVLLDATPQQAAQLLSGVSHEVMAGAIGQQTSGVHIQGQAKADDLAKLSTLSSAVDDLDIWNFGDDTGKSA